MLLRKITFVLRKRLLEYSDQFVSKWLILLLDTCLLAFSFIMAYVLRFNFDFNDVPWEYVNYELLFVISLFVFASLVFQSHAGIIRHTSGKDIIKLLNVNVLVGGSAILFSVLQSIVFNGEIQRIPFSVIIITFFITLFFQIALRGSIKVSYYRIVKGSFRRIPILIYGAGEQGIITKDTMLSAQRYPIKIEGFVDDNPSKVGKLLDGIKIYPSAKALTEEFVQDHGIREVVIAMQNIQPSLKRDIVDRCLELNLHVKNVPDASKWISGELKASQIREVKIEDLLEREPISLSKDNIRREVEGKTILVTGAAGSIGREIVRQLTFYPITKLIILDKDESGLYEVEFDLKTHSSSVVFETIVGDICDSHNLDRVFQNNEIDLIYHAAAYKHVPLVENDPYIGIKVNVLGTKQLADYAVKYGIEKFVMISTDKAVNPTNVMGASKRAAEIYTQSLNYHNNKTRFVTTRFGNVLGSNGSVIPLFRKQIRNGGPITVTHPDITRYFMTIPEACQLVLEAGAMGEGGEIFVFDMGKSVRIIEVAKKMIRLSGFQVDKDIEIKITGLRPGEKLYEELLNNDENTMPTYHPKVMKGQVKSYEWQEISDLYCDLNTKYAGMNNMELVKVLKMLIPEFKSNNSIYESLDKEIQEEVN